MMALIVLLAIREMVWKGIALWKAGTKKQLAWFVCLFIFNTAGILPILYLIFRQKKGK
jgi:methionyl-tRNA synthetase